MLYAILSDVHSNLEALERVCAHAQGAGAQRYVCLGDNVGYGADPGPTLERLMALPGLIAVRGNHDDAIFREHGMETSDDIRASLDWTRTQLTSVQRAFLAGLPLLHRELPPADGMTPAPRLSATFVHASAHRPTAWDYLRASEQIRACLEEAGTTLTFIGHVHVPRIFYEMPDPEAANGPPSGSGILFRPTSSVLGVEARDPRFSPIGDVREFEPPDGVPIPLSPYRRYVINVGSVGQPRDGNSAACYVLYDDEAAEITFHRLAYDYIATAAKIRAAGLSPFFADRLAAGR